MKEIKKASLGQVLFQAIAHHEQQTTTTTTTKQYGGNRPLQPHVGAHY